MSHWARVPMTSASRDLLPGTAIPVVIIIYMLKFTTSYPERVSHTETSAPVTS